MNPLTLMIRWCRGVGHVRGYGIQSPFAYNFVRKVAGNTCTDVCPEKLRSLGKMLTRRERRAGKLCFHISAWWKPSILLPMGAADHFLCRYMRIGNAHVVLSNDVSFIKCEYRSQSDSCQTVNRVIVCVTEPKHADVLFSSLSSWATADVVVIVNDIWRDCSMHRLWERLLEDSHTGVTFDFGSIGVAFFDAKYYKRQYLLNCF